jgi:segregation and condensation protein A
VTAAPDAPGSDAPVRFSVRVQGFEGPFDLLLSLIAKHQLELTALSLSAVTDDFIGHIRAQGEDWNLDETTEFLVVAATLLDLKAARLLPGDEEEDEEDLALLEARDLLFARLLQYRAFKEMAAILGGFLGQLQPRRPRTVGLDPGLARLLPEVQLHVGPAAFARIARAALEPKPPPQVSVAHVHAPAVSVREQAALVAARVHAAGAVPFAQLVADAPDRLHVVARFLAALELYREGRVALEQDEPLTGLLLRWTGGEDPQAQALQFDEFDEPEEPGQPGEEAADG